MRKWFVLLLSIVAVPIASYAQAPLQARLVQYERLEHQRQELESWLKKNSYTAAPWNRIKKEKLVEEITRQQYEQFSDVEIWNMKNAQRFIAQSNEILKGQLPYVDSNRFSQENLDKLVREQPAILAELLFAYPENMAFVDTKYMVERVFSDKGFKLFFNDYLSYLKSYTQEPACIDNMRQYYQNHLKIVLKNKRPSVVMNVLAAGCNDYVARKLEKESLERFLEYAFWSRSLPNGQNQSARSPYAVYAAKVEQ